MSRRTMMRCVPMVILIFSGLFALSQRPYKSNSILSAGVWYKIGVNNPGIYKIDLAFLKALGINTSGISSSSIRLFGNSGGMLPEAANGIKTDDLEENAIWVEDGGDGLLDGSDYILFYASGPHKWGKDSVNKTFFHIKNLYTETAYYFLTIGGTGKRINTVNFTTTPNTSITSFNEYYFHELDTVNFLSSGKQWYGEEFSNAPGKTLKRSFKLPISNLTNQPATIVANSVARSFGVNSSFNIKINTQAVMRLDIPSVAPGPFDEFAKASKSAANFTPSGSDITVEFEYTPGSFNSQAWLDWFEIFARRNLSLSGINQLLFRDWTSVAAGNVGEFRIQNSTATTQVWDVTNTLAPVKMQGSLNGTELRFINDCQFLKEYVAFNNTGFPTPIALGKINNQNLHNSAIVDYLMVTHSALLSQAQRLAQYHEQKNNLRTTIVTSEQVYNEFSSGTPDPTAIRDFVKMYYDKAGNDSTKRPKYLLLFGDASFDYKNRIANNTNLVPAYESSISLDPLSTYTSDDFFGLLDDGDNINENGVYLLDIGIGRIPAKNVGEAKAYVDKILSYTDAKSLGPWRNELSFVADDEDANLHLQDAEVITTAASNTSSLYNIDKIYLDAHQQESGPGGSRYPEVNNIINNKIYNGTLIWNYSGHGGYRRLAEEVVLDQNIINGFNNPHKLPLFITATCDVAPFDNPLVSSIGENLLLREKTGAIALMTTTRLVFAFSNRIMNKNYLETALKKKADGTYPTLGEAVRNAKNTTYTFFGDVINNRKFTLLGDPALTLAFPLKEVRTTAINNINIGTTPDTLKALAQYTVSGTVNDNAGNILTDFNGTVYPTVFDKATLTRTKANDAGSLPADFTTQKNILFKGKARVVNGLFNFSFVVPKDINYQFGNGRISYYADNGQTDGNGVFTNVIIGGTGGTSADNDGPDIKVFLNDEKFMTGNTTNEKPLLLVKLADTSGINIMGTGIGHDLVAVLDNDPEKKFILNEFYETETDNFRKGVVRYQLPEMDEGLHTLTIKAWDAVNNSNEASIEFKVIKEQDFTLRHVLNYPNPFTTHTSFWFEHNRPPAEELQLNIQIFTVTGKLVKTLRNTIISTGNRSNEVEWDGRDEYGSKIGRGVYIYRLKVKTADGQTAEKLEKLFIL